MAAGPRRYLTSAQVRDRYSITDMTLWRWLNRPEMAFPRPLVINRRRLFAEDELVAWERKQVKGRSDD